MNSHKKIETQCFHCAATW